MRSKIILGQFGAGIVCLLLSQAAGRAQVSGSYNEREVKPRINVQDKDDIWVLEFRFKDPRLITVDVPGRGRKVVWYLWYQVINRTGQPRTFIPELDLVTLDKPGAYHDQVLPKVQEAIRRIEDPTGRLDIKNSVTISNQPIPVSKPEAVPRAVTGVAMWDNINPDANRYSIFVSGLSNGVWYVEDVGGKQTVRRKTLQLNFKRLGDRYNMDSREIRFVGPAEWIYRASSVAAPAQEAPAPPKEEAPKTTEDTLKPRAPFRKLRPLDTAEPPPRISGR